MINGDTSSLRAHSSVARIAKKCTRIPEMSSNLNYILLAGHATMGKDTTPTRDQTEDVVVHRPSNVVASIQVQGHKYRHRLIWLQYTRASSVRRVSVSIHLAPSTVFQYNSEGTGM